MSLRITVAIALADRQEVVALELAEGSTVADALAAARVADRLRGWTAGGGAMGVWSQRCDPSRALRDGDRVEVYRPLRADPRHARRSRARLTTSSTRSRTGR